MDDRAYTTQLRDLAVRLDAELRRYGLETMAEGNPVAQFEALLRHLDGNHAAIISVKDWHIAELERQLNERATQ
jgi:hypothetical protein